MSTLKTREEKFINLYVNTLEYVTNAESSAGLTFIFSEIIVTNQSIPVIITDEQGSPLEFKNIPKATKAKSKKERQQILLREMKEMEKQHSPLLIVLKKANKTPTYQFVYYKNSELLTQLKYYPMTQLMVIAVFGGVIFFVFSASKTSEQNKVWAGLAKETAHQLGTPLSSLMAWVEYLKSEETLNRPECANEIQKDVERLNTVAERFSNIGSVPVLENTNIYQLITHTVSYLKTRLSSKVTFTLTGTHTQHLEANINSPLFEWVIENLIKNAVDAMAGTGHVHIKVWKAGEGHIIIDLTDSGKGIQKGDTSKIFQPGFTTKKRGWGLGLTLTKRIIERYHKGEIFVKHTTIGQGTTFRISLKT